MNGVYVDKISEFTTMFYVLYENIFLTVLSDMDANTLSVTNVVDCELKFQMNKERIYRILEKLGAIEFKEFLEEIDKEILKIKKKIDKIEKRLKEKDFNDDEILLSEVFLYDGLVNEINRKNKNLVRFLRFLEGDEKISKLFNIAKILYEFTDKIDGLKRNTMHIKKLFKTEEMFLDVYDVVVDFEYNFKGKLVKNLLRSVIDEFNFE